MQTSVLRLFIYLFIFLFNSLSDLRKSDRRISSGQTRKVLYATRAMRENQKTRDFTENSGKISKKIIVFSFSQIYGVLLVP